MHKSGQGTRLKGTGIACQSSHGRSPTKAVPKSACELTIFRCLTAGPDGGIIASVRDPTKSPVDEGEAPRPAGTPFPPARRDRIWEIDFLRGLSIILMVGYHLLYDLGAMAGVQSLLGFTTDLTTPAWLAAQYFFAGLFVVLSGISSTLSRGNVRRALKLLAVALLVSAVTYAFNSAGTVHFGILHCLAFRS